MSNRFLSRLKKFTLAVILFAVLTIASLLVTSWALEPQPFGTALAPDPLHHQDAIIQVYGADVWGFRGNFVIHTWIATKARGAADYQVYQVIGWRLRRGRSVVSITEGNPARAWYGSPAILLQEMRGNAAEALIDEIRKLTDKPVRFVINTHWHGDHVHGNQVYRDQFPDMPNFVDDQRRLLGGFETR